ncbi:PDR/VanB family oxidoreductase [Micromonospora sp. NBC_01796]|uniref:PDR/VanB family oxidoreductase n=1 Tax=Micromonospora sp. NBC_01796 TaxID=2975987 RepID=UPI002DDC530A|nr:PDR/VanB family oxidoreductase [Micromonospora sp. NBC_01796]WSA85551.1 PDR/VanB family oxidoreductase [Micromonospora sp. NBC_01796]
MGSTGAEEELDLVVRHRERAAEGVVRLTLAAPDGRVLPDWSAGAHIDVILDDGSTRQYSLCGDVDEARQWTIAVLLEPTSRGGSRFMHDNLAAGDTVRVQGPRNHFALEPAPRYVFVAGGIGITPIVPMLAAAESAGVPWRLVYGGRTRSSMAFVRELTERYGDRVAVRPQDETGLLDLDRILADPDPATLVYCCGPEPLLLAVEATCRDRRPGTLRVERFAPKEQGAPVRAGSFEVELAQSGLVLTVPPDRSVLETIEDAGVDVLYSCTEGTCGTCETSVLAGEPDHRDSLLTDEEQAANDTMYICVSRSRGPRLVLDL